MFLKNKLFHHVHFLSTRIAAFKRNTNYSDEIINYRWRVLLVLRTHYRMGGTISATAFTTTTTTTTITTTTTTTTTRNWNMFGKLFAQLSSLRFHLFFHYYRKFTYVDTFVWLFAFNQKYVPFLDVKVLQEDMQNRLSEFHNPFVLIKYNY